MFLMILSAILVLNITAYATQGHFFEISVRTNFRSIFLHKMIAEREVLSLGRECSMKEFPQQIQDWVCDSDVKGVLCKTGYTCEPHGGRDKRYAHIKGIENLLTKEIRDTREYKKLEEVKYSSKNGSYFLKTNYNPSDKNVAPPPQIKTVPMAPPARQETKKKDRLKELFSEEIPFARESFSSDNLSSSDEIPTSDEIPAEDIPTEYLSSADESFSDDISEETFAQDIPVKEISARFPASTSSTTDNDQALPASSHGNLRPGEGKIMEFDLALSWITDNNNGSLRTTHIAWTPKYKLDSTFMIGIDFGAQVLESTADENYFIATDGAVAGHFFILNKTYVKISGGVQKWSGDTRGTYSFWGAGLGFELSSTISRFFIQYVKLDNPTENEEFRVGLGISL